MLEITDTQSEFYEKYFDILISILALRKNLNHNRSFFLNPVFTLLYYVPNKFPDRVG